MAFGLSWGNTTLSFAFVIYILVSVSLGLFLMKFMYTLNKPISAMIVLILLLLIFFFFGKRWFQYGQLKGTTAWTQANALTQSGSTATPTTGQCSDGAAARLNTPSVWPPVVNYCPDFMIVDASGNCIDKNKLYGEPSSLGTTTISTYTGNKNVCSSVTGPASKYLRWEGVIQEEGACNPENIGKPPSI